MSRSLRASLLSLLTLCSIPGTSAGELSYPEILLDDVEYVITAPTRWEDEEWHIAGWTSLAMVGTALVIDRPLRDEMRRHNGDNSFITQVERFGAQYAAATVGGFYLAGMLTDDERSVQVAQDGIAAILIASGIITPAIKLVTGRSRPRANQGVYHFKPFSETNSSFPSGHTMRDAQSGTLKPIYNFLNEGRSMEGTPAPFLPVQVVQNTFRRLSSFDAGRGCPFQCSFCTIINVQGRTSRYRSADDVERIIRANLQQGVGRFFITDDDFARNCNWEAILDRCIQLREQEGLVISFTAQVDVGAYKIPRFVEKCARAGCKNIFIGLESLNPESLAGAKKRQNKICQYRKMLQVWKDHGCTTVAGYILGFPADTPDSITRDIEIVKNELPLDGLEFFCLTPLPGSEDHRKHMERGAWSEPDKARSHLRQSPTPSQIGSSRGIDGRTTDSEERRLRGGDVRRNAGGLPTRAHHYRRVTGRMDGRQKTPDAFAR